MQVVDTVQEQTQHATLFLADIDLFAVSTPEKEEFLALLGCFRHVFAQEGQPQGRTTVVKHHIEKFGPPLH